MIEASARAFFLCGFMGVGKSTVGPLLAKRLNRTFVDTDQMVIEKAGCEISEIFSREGESHFRKLEREALTALQDDFSKNQNSRKIVVSLGGGILAAPENFRIVNKLGRLIYLKATEATLLGRLAETASTRPLLAQQPKEAQAEKIRAMMVTRAPVYEKAELQISTDDLTPEDVVEKIISQISEKAL